MRLLFLRIGVGNLGTRFAQPKAPLSEQALTLAYRQMNLELLLDPSAQRLPIPERSLQTQLARGPAQGPVQFLKLCLTQALRTPRALSFGQSGQPSDLKASHPVLYRTRCVAQQPADVRTGHALRHQQHPMKAVIVARLFRTVNLVLQSQNHGFGISNL